MALSRARRLVVSPWGLTLAVVAVAGIVIRVWVYRSPLGIPNSDEAIVGLISRHFIDGHFTTFYWGQAYGGSQEALLAVPGFLLAGSSWLALRIVPLGLFLAGLLIVWRIGLRTVGRTSALAAVALFWLWPPWMIYELTHEWGFYGCDVVYSGLLVLLGLRIVERPDRTRVGLFGLVLGLAFWETSQIIPIAIAVIAWTVWKEPRCLRHAWLAAVLAVLGALPWIVWNAGHGWGSFSLPSGAKTSYGYRLRLFLSPVLPMMLGLRTPFSQAPLGPAVLVDLVYAALFALFVLGAYKARRRPTALLYGAAALFPFVYGLAVQTFNASDPRYVAVLTPVLVLIISQAMTTWPRAAAVLIVAGVVSFATLHRMEPLPEDLTAGAPIAPRNIAPLISALDGLHIDRVYAPYWLAYVIDFDTRERIIAVENKFNDVSFRAGQAVLPDVPVRNASYQQQVKSSRHAIVLFKEGIGKVAIVPALERHRFRRIPVGPFLIFVPGTE